MTQELKVPEITRTSSKGQIVIPASIRKKLGIKHGSILAVTAKNNMIVIKKLDTKMKPEDLKTLKSIEEAWADIEKGRYKARDKETFFKELKKW